MTSRTSVVLLALAACSNSPSATPDAGSGSGGSADAGPTADAATACPRTAAPADRTRRVVVAHPYTDSGDSSGAYESIDLSGSGVLTRTGHTFQMGPGDFGTIAFTPDGQVGVVADDNGALNVFALADDGTATVIASQVVLPYYAGRVVMDPSGAFVWVIDGDTGSNGGGLYRVDLACDGTPTDRGLVAAGSTPGGMAFRADGAALVAAGALLDSPAQTSAHLATLGDPPARLASADAFGDDQAIIGGTALTADGSAFLIGDTNFSGTNRVAAVAVGATSLTPIDVMVVDDPEGIVASPFTTDHTAIVTDAFGDKIFILDDAGSGGSWRVRGQVAYQAGTSPPQLPGDVASIRVGPLRGRTFVSEVDKIRQLAFDGSGGVADVGSLRMGSATSDALGAIGVTP